MEMTKTTLCTVQLLNKSYTIKCPEEEVSNLELAAKKLSQQMAEKKNTFKGLDDFQGLLLAALHISHELIVCEQQQSQQRLQLAEFIHAFEGNLPKTE
jgi:cell division protein ZapA